MVPSMRLTAYTLTVLRRQDGKLIRCSMGQIPYSQTPAVVGVATHLGSRYSLHRLGLAEPIPVPLTGDSPPIDERIDWV